MRHIIAAHGWQNSSDPLGIKTGQRTREMIKKMTRSALAIWRGFRRLPLFWQLVLLVPLLCGAIPYLLIGNMGLALMGTAIPIYTFLVGWAGGVAALFWGRSRVKATKQTP
jgi:hypothetical protein